MSKATHTDGASNIARLQREAPHDILDAIEQQPWRAGLEPCGEFPTYVVDATCITGKLPADLAGTLYRNGPGRVRIGDHKYGHWFDGDGQMTAIRFDGSAGTVRVTSKLVKTPRYNAQQAAGEKAGIVVRGAWTQATSFMNNVLALPTNPSNTSVLMWDNKLLALCEGGDPYELNAETLETVGPARFHPSLPLGFSAHFKIDEATNTLYNFGLMQPPKSGIATFALDDKGTLLRRNEVSLPVGQLAFVHDWAMSDNYLCAFIPPWMCQALPSLQAVIGFAPLGHQFEWTENAPTRVVILRKSDLSVVADTTVPSMSTYHFANAYEVGTRLHVQVNKLIGSRADLEKQFTDMYSANFQTGNYNELYEYVFDLSSSGRLESHRPLMPREGGAMPMEFPVINAHKTGQASRYIYTTAFSGRDRYFDAVQKLDTEKGVAQTRLCAPGVHPSEVAFIAKPGAQEEDAGYIVYIVYDSSRHASDVVVVDAQDFEGEPLCTIALRHHIPYTFHGWWQPAAQAAAASRGVAR